MKTVTISRKNIQDDLVIISKGDLERISKENKELKLALKAIIAGEKALRTGNTRTFKEFLKSMGHG